MDLRFPRAEGMIGGVTVIAMGALRLEPTARPRPVVALQEAAG